MKLREWDWDLENFVEREYPDEIIKSFVEFMRTNNQWQDHPDLVVDRYRHLQRELTDAYNAAPKTLLVCTAETATGQPCRINKGIVDGFCHIHRRSLVDEFTAASVEFTRPVVSIESLAPDSLA